jgi:hypothetical protein
MRTPPSIWVEIDNANWVLKCTRNFEYGYVKRHGGWYVASFSAQVPHSPEPRGYIKGSLNEAKIFIEQSHGVSIT